MKQTTKRRWALATGILLGLMFTGAAWAQSTLFYRNISPGGLSSPSYTNPGPYEYADDVPFTGSHLVSSFKVGYRSPEAVRAYFRFYGVDQDTGLPGQMVAQISRELPAADFTTTIIALDPDEQFIFNAEPGLFGKNLTGGWFSVQFESLTGDILPSFYFGIQLAGYTSSTGIYDITHDNILTIFDPSGILPASLYLELYSSPSDNAGGSVIPGLAEMTLSPAAVTVGERSRATVRLSGQAPFGGVRVKFRTNRRGVYFSKSEVTVPEGDSSAQVYVYARRKAAPRRGRTQATAQIIAETADSSISAELTISR